MQYTYRKEMVRLVFLVDGSIAPQPYKPLHYHSNVVSPIYIAEKYCMLLAQWTPSIKNAFWRPTE